MERDITRWQDAILAEEKTAPDELEAPILHLFTTAGRLYSLLLQSVKTLLPTPEFRKLEREHDRLRLWADGYGVISGNLDHVLADATRMRHSTIRLLVRICCTLAKSTSQFLFLLLGRLGMAKRALPNT